MREDQLLRDSAVTESVGSEPIAIVLPPVLPRQAIVANRYEIRGILGKGGYAVVYLAYDRQLQMEVALKALRADRYSEATLTRFKREVSVARQVSSPNLVSIYDVGVDGDLWYLTMEVVRGETLRERMRRDALSTKEALRIVNSILEALQALHGVGIVHRDLKPENILLPNIGGVKIVDFGLARFLDEEHLTQSTDVLGTARYFSPEQALGHSVDQRSDLYTVGLILFEMLAGQMPFGGDSSLSGVIARLHVHAPSIRKYRRDVPPWLSSVVARLLRREQADRYETASDVMIAVARHKFDVRSLLSATRTLLVVAVAMLVATAIVLARRHESMPQFDRLQPTGDRRIAAIGRGGQILWWRSGIWPEAHYALAQIEPGKPRAMAVVFERSGDFSPASRQTLSFLDPETGKSIREVTLPSSATDFPSYPDRYIVRSLLAVDLNHDGIDEVLVGYNHVPEAPSYFVLYEPKINRARVVFEGMGGHLLMGTRDIDGDGHAELMIGGINNGVNWYNVLAAVRIKPWIDETTDPFDVASVRSPDMNNTDTERLLWYALMPRGREPENPAGLRWDSARRNVTLDYTNRPPVVVSYDGFLKDDQSTLPAAQREGERRAAWGSYCKSMQLHDGDYNEEAVAEARAAVSHAQRAGEPILTEVMRTTLAKVLIAAGKISEGEALAEDLVAHSENAPEISYDVGRAFHLHGDLDKAIAWYHRGIGAGAPLEVGKSKHEYIQAIIMALAEQGDWKRAAEETERFRSVYVKSRMDWMARYREFIRWRVGESPRIEEIPAPSIPTDLERYWMLEFRNARGESALALLLEVEREISWHAEPMGPLWSLKAVLLDRLGRGDAAAAARTAWEIGSADARKNLIARGHLSLIRERAARLAPDALRRGKG